jgi:twitching motility protein PilT
MLRDLLKKTCEQGASDLLLVAGAPPVIFVGGQWRPLSQESLTPPQIEQAIAPILSSEQRARLERIRDVDLGLDFDGAGRFRVNLHYQRGTPAAALRAVPAQVPAFDDLGLPPQVRRCADFPNGLVLIAGPTGQGKSTTLASLVNEMNRARRAHVITIEDPIEFSFPHGACVIEQRQIGDDSPSFASALKHVLRQRPDVILIGELRDLETVATALTAAETGHLVLASLHTAGASQSLARIIDVFPAEQQPHVRTQVAASLRAIVCQTLLRDQLNDRLTPATEILIANSAIRRAVRDNETHLIYGMLETGRRYDMHTLEQSLAELVRSGRVAAADAFAASSDPIRLQTLTGVLMEPDAGNGDSFVAGFPANPSPSRALAWAAGDGQ